MAARNLQVQFGLISINTKKESAVDKPASNVNLCEGQPGHPAHTPTPVTMPKTCIECGEISDYSALVKGIKQGTGYAVVSQEDIAEAKADTSDQYKGKVNLIPHPAKEFYDATAPGASINYLTPADQANADHYALLYKLIEEHPDVAFTSLHTPMSKTGLYVVKARNGVLVLEERTRTQNLKPAPSHCTGVVNDALYNMLVPMMEATKTPYDADQYEDEYEARVSLLAAAATVVAGPAKVDTSTPSAPVSDDDLMAQLAALAKAAS